MLYDIDQEITIQVLYLDQMVGLFIIDQGMLIQICGDETLLIPQIRLDNDRVLADIMYQQKMSGIEHMNYLNHGS